jgi:gamma-glutamylcyclotransferase (GGCT)/AIG2-like uncharacterized protein YtfP
MSDYLFAYGTLQPGLAPTQVARVAAKLQPVGEGFVRGALYDLGGYPGAVPDPKAPGRIAGAVMELPEDESVLKKLDAYEGFDPEAPGESEFVRVRQAVELKTGGTVECWIYCYNRKTDRLSRIEDRGSLTSR